MPKRIAETELTVRPFSVVASGINDIANSVLYGLDYESSVERLVEVYTEQVRRMYTRGGKRSSTPPSLLLS